MLRILKQHLQAGEVVEKLLELILYNRSLVLNR